MKFQLNTIEEAIEDIRAGKIIIAVDDEDRENEGDFICAAEKITPELINFMAMHGRGLICTSITKARAEKLELPLMVQKNTDLHETAFTVSIDYKGEGSAHGISAQGRAATIKAMITPTVNPADFVRPGHTMPLIAKDGGVLRRTGHTEASADLARLAGFAPAGVLVEIMNEDGTMARLPELVEIAAKLDVKIVTIKDLVAYRMSKERLVQRDVSLNLKTPLGEFELIAFKEMNTNLTHLVIKKGEWNIDEPVLTRVHSASNSNRLIWQIMEGFDSKLRKSLYAINREGKGVVVLLQYAEGENALLSTMRALKVQQENNEALNPFTNRPQEDTQRDLGIGAQIINNLGIRKIRLMTSRIRKRVGLIGYGLEIVEETVI